MSEWDAIARTSWKKSARQRWFHDYILYPHIRSLAAESSKTLLDYGCGSGELIRFLDTGIERVDGYDPSAEMAVRASRANPNNRIVSAIDRLTPRGYDAVVLNLVLPVVDNPSVPIREAVSLLAQRGHIYCSIAHPCFALVSSLHTTTRREWVIPQHSDELRLYFSNPVQRIFWDDDDNHTLYHYRTITDYFQLFTDHNLAVEGLYEPQPIKDGKSIPELYELFTMLPAFLSLWLRHK